MKSIDELSEKLRSFSTERDWDSFHTPKNLAASIVIESAELLEIFQWSRGQNHDSWSELQNAKIKSRVEEELADIFLYLIQFAKKANIDLQKAAEDKILINANKYPIEKSKSSDKKYNE